MPKKLYRKQPNMIQLTKMSMMESFGALYQEIDELKEKVSVLEGGKPAKAELTKENFKECTDKNELEKFGKTLGIDVKKSKSVENIIADIEAIIKGEE